MKLQEQPSVALRGIGAVTLTKPTLAINAASAATFKTTGTTTYVINGVFYTKIALSAQAFSAGHPSVNAGYTCFYVVAVDAAGTVTTHAGIPFVPQTVSTTTTPIVNGVVQAPVITTSTIYVDNPQLPTISKSYNSVFLPDIPENVAPLGVIKVTVNSGQTFVPTQTALDNTTILSGSGATFTDVSMIPANATL